MIPKLASAQGQGFFQHRIKYRCETTRRRVDDAQYLGGRGLLTRFGKFSLTLGKLTFEIGYPPLGIGERAVGRRAHLRTLSDRLFWADRTVSGRATIGC